MLRYSGIFGLVCNSPVQGQAITNIGLAVTAGDDEGPVCEELMDINVLDYDMNEISNA